MPKSLDDWKRDVEKLLSGNRIVVGEHRYTAPSLDTAGGRRDYANQFMWDSCFHAIAWRWIDPSMAQAELLALVSRQVKDGPDAGMIPHCNYWRGGAAYLWGQDERSSITQPPLVAVAAKLVYERSADKPFLETIYRAISAYHDWFDRRRDPDGDGLVALIHPWESGGDALPRWDQSMKLGTFSNQAAGKARTDLAHTLAEYDMDARALAEAGWFHVEPMDYNAIRAADMEAMADIAQILGKPDVAGWQHRVDAVRQAFQTKMLIGDRPYDLAGIDESPVLQDSSGQIVTLFGGLPTQNQADKLLSQLRRVTLLDAVSGHDHPVRCRQLRPRYLLARQRLALRQLADLSRLAALWLRRSSRRAGGAEPRIIGAVRVLGVLQPAHGSRVGRRDF